MTTVQYNAATMPKEMWGPLVVQPVDVRNVPHPSESMAGNDFKRRNSPMRKSSTNDAKAVVRTEPR
jgi:hypothetical protein